MSEERITHKYALRCALRSYCINENLCTRASNTQYEIMLSLFAKVEEQDDTCGAFDNLAAMLWICSDTDKSLNQLSIDLANIYGAVIAA